MAYIGNNPKWNTGKFNPQSSVPSNPTEGTVYYDDGTNRPEGLYVYKNSVWECAGGANKDLDIFHTQDFESFSTVNASGNNATFLGGGTLDGAFSLNTSTEISGLTSGRYTAGASSNNDYIEIQTIDLSLKQRSADIGVSFIADMSSFANNVTFVIYDKTNAAVLTNTTDILTASKARSFYFFNTKIPLTCTQISFGFHINDGATNTETFDFDDFVFKTNGFALGDLNTYEEARYHTRGDADGRASTNTAILYASTLVNNLISNAGTVDNDSANGWSFTATKQCYVSMTLNMASTSTSWFGISKNTTGLTTNIESLTSSEIAAISFVDVANQTKSVTFSGYLEVGDILRPHVTTSTTVGANDEHLVISIATISQNPSVITPQTGDNSMIRLNTGNGHGSTNTKIRRFSTTVQSIGNAITYADSATDGASFTINEAGSYNISFTNVPNSSTQVGISVNSSELTTNVDSITAADRLAYSSPGSATDTVSWSGELNPGDVIRAHTNGDGTSTANTQFTISKIGYKQLSAVPQTGFALAYADNTSEFLRALSGSTSYTLIAIPSIEGGEGFASRVANAVTLQPGRYIIGQNIGSFNGAGWVDYRLLDALTNNTIKEYFFVMFSTSGDPRLTCYVETLVELNAVTNVEFYVKSGNAAGSMLYSDIFVKKIG